jgi:hypothetical protein
MKCFKSSGIRRIPAPARQGQAASRGALLRAALFLCGLLLAVGFGFFQPENLAACGKYGSAEIRQTAAASCASPSAENTGGETRMEENDVPVPKAPLPGNNDIPQTGERIGLTLGFILLPALAGVSFFLELKREEIM